jgi:hypothetical protein
MVWVLTVMTAIIHSVGARQCDASGSRGWHLRSEKDLSRHQRVINMRKFTTTEFDKGLMRRPMLRSNRERPLPTVEVVFDACGASLAGP